MKIICWILFCLWPINAAAQSQAHGFEDGQLAPFITEVCCGNAATVVAPAFGARAGAKVERMEWRHAGYDGGRTSKGVESTTISAARIKKEGWYGFSFYLPSNEFRFDKDTIIAQMHSYTPTCNPAKTIALSVGNSDRLDLTYWYGDANLVEYSYETLPLARPTPRDRWVDIVIHVRYSRSNQGLIEVWYDGAPKDAPSYRRTNINIGSDCWNGDELLNGTYQKWGIYAWNQTLYTPGETRVNYFDQISYLNGTAANAWEQVSPGSPLNQDDPLCVTARAGGPWMNRSFPAQPGEFTFEFTATPTAAQANALVALSQEAQSTYPGFAALVRFNPNGQLDARNGAAYTADRTISYAADKTYRFRLAINVAARLYSVFVTPPNEAEQPLALNYQFRGEQSGVTTLNFAGANVDTTGNGALRVCYTPLPRTLGAPREPIRRDAGSRTIQP